MNRSGATSITHILPTTTNNAGAYSCEVTVGTTVSSYSATTSITTTGFNTVFLILTFLVDIEQLQES